MESELSSAEVTLQLLQTARRLDHRIAEQLAPLDTTLQQLKVLSLVQAAANGRMTVNEIRERMLDPMSNVSRLLNKMMQKGLIEKVRGSDDQRVVRVALTEAGFDLYCRGGDVLAQGLTQLDTLAPEDLAQLSRLLDAIPKG
jgi:DNA-binding MarR family transcriptional regulator